MNGFMNKVDVFPCRRMHPNRLSRSAPYLLRKLRRESLIRGAIWAQNTFANSGKQFHNRKQGTERRALYLFFNSLRLFFISLDKVRSSILAEKSNNAKIRDFTII